LRILNRIKNEIYPKNLRGYNFEKNLIMLLFRRVIEEEDGIFIEVVKIKRYKGVYFNRKN